MKVLWVMLCALLATATVHASPKVWQPEGHHVQIPIWPGTPPDAQAVPGPEKMAVSKGTVGGKPYTWITNVTRPTMTVYRPSGHNTGAAMVVFPGGGFQILAIDLEGSEICHWLTHNGITCVLLKYRVPGPTYDWHCDCRPHNFQTPTLALDDAQRTLSLVRYHAQKWHIDPHKIGVIGFSAGGYLVAEASTRYTHRLYKPVDAADKVSMRPDFAAAIYPGHLDKDGTLNPNVPVTRDTPPTFIVQAEDDDVDGVQQALTYFDALKKAKVPTELHIYAHGGHAFGLRPTKDPITHWPTLMKTWLKTIGVLENAT
ncbi:alpha/beta hydrolase [Oleiagrimonas sp. C23AA]|uniref:alpha/beta hydrolase n=1 Tax=Oleiagrimonas sp. C23AA TaxID=2719047 RepID=UPI001421A796|nr:alpha/beta hydrolase [Oleiagrimonas sp. C23AA]NII09081.1 alpha/beta hydrolase [Oleiagrimonas sp. C23AA]